MNFGIDNSELPGYFDKIDINFIENWMADYFVQVLRMSIYALSDQHWICYRIVYNP